ncbi:MULTISPECIES: DUF6230 family protein [unclassified Nocardioides]|uniref:DUF6230 family protein n=1 Tax=unclassified Nocardioides TaxID=2615069 RepID=UPI0007030D2E|nr:MULTISPECIES: DUF6230 family protein [unclassified Nocardioides]KRC52838.1 hypothetical protein ASE19_10530 [Nocardioides sp. Root79]KRC72369.1 hypothetical protein ASE20_07065 [Nocardioides sp. Root240]
MTGRRGRADVLDRVRRAAATRSTAMVDRAEVHRGTRRRALVPLAGGLGALVAMFQLVSSNVLAVNFTTANQEFQLYSNYLQGAQAAGFLSTNDTSTGEDNGVAELGIRSAKLAGLCAIAHENVPVVGEVTLMILAGVPVRSSFATGANTTTDGAGNPLTYDADGLLTGGNHITASNLFINSRSLNGFGNLISGMNLGQSADTVDTTAGITWPGGQTQPDPGDFGLTVDRINVGGLGGDTYGINLQGAITLPNLKIKVVKGHKTQADCPSQAAG